MVSLHLTVKEAAILASVLESYLSDLRMEIADTDRLEFRDALKERKDVIQKVLDAIAHVGA
jgi:hypothetical protein